MVDYSFRNVPLDWEDIEDWCVKVLQGKSLKASLDRLCLGATVYNLWRQRHDLLHNHTPRTKEAILACIRWEARARIVAKGHFKHLQNSWFLVSTPNLQNLIWCALFFRVGWC
jgi:hypothetical protein